MSDNIPEHYNDLVELIKNNDAGTAAQVIQETHTRNGDLTELIHGWRKEREDRDANTLSNVATLSKSECADELEAVIKNE